MKARVAGTEIAYDVRGKGPAVLFLHAFPLGLAMWDGQARALESTHQVIRFDARGFGGTPPGDGLLTMERIADDGAALLDWLDVPSAVVCGLSMGGYAAFAFARRHAVRMRGLVLCDTRSGPDTEEGRTNRSRQADEVRRGGVGVMEPFAEKLAGETTRKRRPEVMARLREMILAASARGITDALAGLAARADSTPALREIRVPTLVVCGTEDALTPPTETEAMHRAITGSRRELIPEAGHVSNMENPAAFNAVLGSFLKSLR